MKDREHARLYPYEYKSICTLVRKDGCTFLVGPCVIDPNITE